MTFLQYGQVIYVETLCNPSSDVPDLEAVVSFAKANNLMTFIDNTFASPVLCRCTFPVLILDHVWNDEAPLDGA